MIESSTGRERFVPIRPKGLIREVYPALMTQTNVDVASVSCENIYVKMPKPSLNRRGKPCTKMKYTRVAAVVGKRIKQEDNKATAERTPSANPNESETNDVAAEDKDAYLLLSNRNDAPSEVMGAGLNRVHWGCINGKG